MNEMNRAPMTAAFYWSERLLDRVEHALARASSRRVPLWWRRLGQWMAGEQPKTLLRRESFCGRQSLRLDARGVVHRGEGFEVAAPWSVIDRIEVDQEGSIIALFPRNAGEAPFVAPLAGFDVSPSVLAGRIRIWREAARRPRREAAQSCVAMIRAAAQGAVEVRASA